MREKVNFLRLLPALIFFVGKGVFPYTGVLGSDSSVAYEEPYTTFDGGEAAGNRIARYAQMRNGFGLNAFGTYVTFDSIFPVGNAVNLYGGTLNLTMPLNLLPQTNLVGGGRFVGECILTPELEGEEFEFVKWHAFDMVFSGNTFTWYRFTLPSWTPNSDYFFSCILRYIVAFNPDGSWVKYSYAPNNYSDARAIPNPTYNGDAVALVRRSGSTNFYYYRISTQAYLLENLYSTTVSGTPKALDVSPVSGDRVVISSDGNGVQLYSIDLGGTYSLSSLSTWSDTTDTFVQEGVEYHKDGRFVAVITTGELRIFDTNGDTLSLVASTSIQNVRSVSWSYDYRLVVVTASTTSNLQIFYFDSAAGTLTQELIWTIPGNVTPDRVSWNAYNDMIVVGHSPDSSSVAGRIYLYDRGERSLDQQYTLSSASGAVGGRFSKVSMLAFEVKQSTSWYRVNVYSSKGTSETILDGTAVKFRGDAKSSALLVAKDNVGLLLHSNRFRFEGDGHISIDRDSSLRISGGTVVSSSTASIFSPGYDTSTLILESCSISSGNPIVIEHGNLRIRGTVRIGGKTILGFSSDSGSMTLEKGAKLIIEDGATLKFHPTGTAQKVIIFEDESLMELNNATLDVSEGGYDSTGGSYAWIIVKGKSVLLGPDLASGLTADFSGSGTTIDVKPGSELDLSGQVKA